MSDAVELVTAEIVDQILGGDLRRKSAWQERQISRGGHLSFSTSAAGLLIVEFSLDRPLSSLEWKRFFDERSTFLSGETSPPTGWVELWCSRTPLESINLDARPVMRDFIRRESARVTHWLVVYPAPSFLAQFLEWPEAASFVTFCPVLHGGLELGANKARAMVSLLNMAREEGQVFEKEDLVAFVDNTTSTKVIRVHGQLSGELSGPFQEWVEALQHQHRQHRLEIDLFHLNYGSTLIQEQVQSKVDAWEKAGSISRTWTDPDFHQGEASLKALVELQKEDISFLRQEAVNLDQRLNREQLASRQALKARKEFLSVINHELRTPLNGVIGMLELLVSSELNAEQEDYVHLASDSSKRLLKLVNNLIDFAKLDQGDLELRYAPFQLNELLFSTISDMELEARRKGIELKAIQETSGLSLKADIVRLKQMMTELLKNAIQHTDQGQVVLQASVVEEKEREVQLRIEVSDTGSGIAPELLQKLFDDFSQVDMSISRKVGGTGLGLSLCRKLAALMGGKMGVQSQLGKGSRFWFTARVDRNLEDDQESIDSLDWQTVLAGIHALVVEGNPISRRVLVSALREIGFEVDVTSNAYAALELANTEPFDLILLDLSMGEVDGFELAREILGSPRPDDHPRPNILALSRQVSAELHCQCLEAGIVGLLSKPMNYENLRKELHSMVKRGDFLAR